MAPSSDPGRRAWLAQGPLWSSKLLAGWQLYLRKVSYSSYQRSNARGAGTLVMLAADPVANAEMLDIRPSIRRRGNFVSTAAQRRSFQLTLDHAYQSACPASDSAQSIADSAGRAADGRTGRRRNPRQTLRCFRLYACCRFLGLRGSFRRFFGRTGGVPQWLSGEEEGRGLAEPKRPHGGSRGHWELAGGLWTRRKGPQ